MNDPGADAAEAVVQHALRRGYLTPTQVHAARAQGGDLLVNLGGFLSPQQRAELQSAHVDAFNAAATLPPQNPVARVAVSDAAAPEAARQVETLRPAPEPAPEGDALALYLPNALRALKPGATFGPYRLGRELGRGGMGVVFEAEHQAVHRRVALKVLASDRTAPRAIQRFVNEARASASLRHPHVVAVHDAGQVGELHYIAMDMIEGESLSERMRRTGALPIDEALRIAVAIADALRAAHEQGILHRDIKPANIMLDADARPYLADFGLAKLTGATLGGLTKSNEIIGTPAYMSPEQATGQGKDGDGRVDIYSLGATLYETLTGQSPFQANSMLAMLAQITVAEPTRPSLLRREVSDDLDALVLRCLEKEPSKRYADASALLAALRFCQSGGERPRPRAPRLIVAALLVTLLGVAATIAVLVNARAHSTDPAETHPTTDDASGVNGPDVDPVASAKPFSPHWVLRTPPNSPSPRFDARMAWDPIQERIVLHGGRARYKAKPLGDTWAWDGAAWTRLSEDGPASASHGLCFDEQRKRLVLYGGITDFTTDYVRTRMVHEWIEGAWRPRTDVGPWKPKPRSEFGMAYDPTEKRIVMHGGTATDTWTWSLDTLGWKLLVRKPTPSTYADVVFDRANRELVRLRHAPEMQAAQNKTGRPGSLDGLRDGAWELREQLDRYHAPLLSAGDALVLLAGRSGPKTLVTDTRIRVGAKWWTRIAGSGPTAQDPAAAYDPLREAVVVFGGRTGDNQVEGETWELRLTPHR